MEQKTANIGYIEVVSNKNKIKKTLFKTSILVNYDNLSENINSICNEIKSNIGYYDKDVSFLIYPNYHLYTFINHTLSELKNSLLLLSIGHQVKVRKETNFRNQF